MFADICGRDDEKEEKMSVSRGGTKARGLRLTVGEVEGEHAAREEKERRGRGREVSTWTEVRFKDARDDHAYVKKKKEMTAKE